MELLYIFVITCAIFAIAEATPHKRKSNQADKNNRRSKIQLFKTTSKPKGTNADLKASSTYAMPFHAINMPNAWNVREPVATNWYGFHQFVPREARSYSGRNSDTSFYMLGEKKPFHSSNTISNPHSRQLVAPQPQQQHYRYVQFDDDSKETSFNHLISNEPLSLSNHRLVSSATPVTFRIIPLKITSRELSAMLRSMSWFPLPLKMFDSSKEFQTRVYNDAFKNNFRGEEHETDIPTYRDGNYGTVSDLPRPSSHVATPLDTPPAVMYDDQKVFDSH